MTLNEMLQDIVNKDYEEILDLAKNAMCTVSNNLKDSVGDDGVATLIYGAMGATMVIDNSFSSLEQKLIADMGLDVDAMFNFLKSIANDEAYIESFDKMVDSCDTETKSALLVLVCSIAAVDEKISVEETGLIRKLLD